MWQNEFDEFDDFGLGPFEPFWTYKYQADSCLKVVE